MDNFEKRMYLEYVIKMFPAMDFSNYSADDFVEDIKENFKTSIYDIPNPRNRRSKEYQDFIRKYREKFKIKLSKIKPIKTPLEEKINIISSIYNLNEIEKQIITFLVMRIKCDIFDNFEGMFSGDKLFVNFRRYVLNIKSANVIHNYYNTLYEKGILVREGCYSREKNLNEKILNLFYYPSIKTEKQIKELLLGEIQNSELEWKDFDHIKKERNLVSKIIKSALKRKTKGVNILLYGNVGTGKTQFSKLISDRLNVELYSVESSKNKKEANRADRISDLCSKQTLLSRFHNACILFDEAEDLFNTDRDSKAFVNKLIEENSVPVFWTTNNIFGVDPAVLRRMTYAIRFEKNSEETRLNIWKNILKKNKMKVDNAKIIELNKNYDIAPALISNAVKSTKLIRGNQNDFECFVDSVAQVVAKKKTVKKEQSVKIAEYNDSLANTDINIKNLTERIKQSNKLNFSLCLYGEPGTGKSEYARYLANELGVEVILKRASDLMSKWVGETEQNIAEAFEEAKKKKAMLIFDEADSFLQSRSNAQRNWEVTQVNEMLTWMESHQYPFVCTTNLMDTLDEASLRRFTFKIKFNFMTNEQVNKAVEHFFGIKDSNLNIKGLTAGDFATVKKKADFLGVTSIEELSQMLYDEVKVKQSKELKNAVGF